MAIENIKKLNVEIQNCNFKGCYLFFSSEFFLLKKLVKKIVFKAVDEEFLAFNFNEFDGTDLNFHDLQNFLSIVPVASKFRVALINNLCYFNFSKADVSWFEQIVKGLPESSIVLVTVSTENFDFNKNKKFQVWLKKFSRVARVFDCSFSSNEAVFKFFSDWVVSGGSRISRANFDFLVSRVSNNWNLVFGELEKLCSYAYGREISHDDVLKLTRLNLNYTAFELAVAILNFELKKALEIFKHLINVDVSLFLIIGAVNTSFIDLFRVFLCKSEGLNEAQICSVFDYRGCEFKIRKALKLVGRYDIFKIRKCIEVLLNLDLKLKTTTVNKVILTEEAIIEMVTSCQNRGLT